MSESKIPVVFATDRNCVVSLGAAIYSILEHAKGEQYIFYIIILQENKAYCDEILNDIKNIFSNLERVFLFMDDIMLNTTNDNLSKAIYYRLYISDLLKNVDKCIYLDCDIIVNLNLMELYDIELENNYMGGIIDWGMTYINPNYDKVIGISSIEEYINSGVLLMNLQLMRQDNLKQKLLDKAFNLHDEIPEAIMDDQDVINIICNGRIKYLDDKYNFYTKRLTNEEMAYDKIIHLAGQGIHRHANYKFNDKWFEKVRKIFNVSQYNELVQEMEKWEEKRRWKYITKKCMPYRDIIIWGFSETGKNVLSYLKNSDIEISSFADNSLDKHKNSYMGKETKSLNEILEEYNKPLFIITSQRFFNQIRNQLVENGVKEEDICFYYNKKWFNYYLLLNKDIYEFELKEIFIKEFKSGENLFESKSYSEWKYMFEDGKTEYLNNISEKYHMNGWLLEEN